MGKSKRSHFQGKKSLKAHSRVTAKANRRDETAELQYGVQNFQSPPASFKDPHGFEFFLRTPAKVK
jgi:hypothetical protein